MNKYLIMPILILMAACGYVDEKKDEKSELLEKLKLTETTIDAQIASLRKVASSSGGQMQDQIKEAIDKLESEKKKIKRLIKRTSRAGQNELKDIKKNFNSLKNDWDRFSKKLKERIEEK